MTSDKTGNKDNQLPIGGLSPTEGMMHNFIPGDELEYMDGSINQLLCKVRLQFRRLLGVRWRVTNTSLILFLLFFADVAMASIFPVFYT